MKSPVPSYGVFLLLAGALHAGAIVVAGMFFHPAPEFTVSAADSVELSLVETPAPMAVEAAPEPEPLPPEPPSPEPPPIEPAPPAPEPAPLPEPMPSLEKLAKLEPAKPKPVPKPASPRRAPASATQAPPGEIAGGLPGAVEKAHPNYLSNPAPPYPAQSRANKEEGVVLLTVAVNAGGRADSVSLARSSGFPLLDQAALTAVRNWRFTPGRVGGIAVSSSVTVPIRFRLDR